MNNIEYILFEELFVVDIRVGVFVAVIGTVDDIRVAVVGCVVLFD
jgi:hypothetical protein